MCVPRVPSPYQTRRARTEPSDETKKNARASHLTQRVRYLSFYGIDDASTGVAHDWLRYNASPPLHATPAALSAKTTSERVLANRSNAALALAFHPSSASSSRSSPFILPKSSPRIAAR